VVAASFPKEMAKDINGFVSFDKDGVLRSFDANNQVIGYYKLNPTEISKMIANLPGDYNKAAMTQAFAGVDGTKVTGEITCSSHAFKHTWLTKTTTDKTQLLTPAHDITSGAADISVNERDEVKGRLENRYAYSSFLLLSLAMHRAETNQAFPTQPRQEGRLHAPVLRCPQRLPERVRPRLHPRRRPSLRRQILRLLLSARLISSFQREPQAQLLAGWCIYVSLQPTCYASKNKADTLTVRLR